MIPTSPPFSTWRYMLDLARYKPALYLSSALMASVISYLFPLIPGLVVRQILDTVSGEAAAGVNLWTLFALLAGIAFTRQLVMLGSAGGRNIAAYCDQYAAPP